MPETYHGAPMLYLPKGTCGVFDLLEVILNWGGCGGHVHTRYPSDLNCDGLVNITDLLLVITQWGG